MGDEPIEQVLSRRGTPFRLIVTSALVLVIFWFGVFNENEFIYFQF